MFLTHNHSNSQHSKAVEMGRYQRRDTTGALHPVSSKHSRALPIGRLQQRVGIRIRVVATRPGRTFMQQTRAHLQTEAGVSLRMLGADVQ